MYVYIGKYACNICVCKYVGICKKAGKKEFLVLGLLLGCSFISRKNAVDGRMLVTARAAPKAQTSLLWLIIHILRGRERNVIP
jgi:hypothetical protein